MLDGLSENSCMEHGRTSIPGLLTFTPTPIRDERGFFCRTYDVDVARAAGLDQDSFVQDSLSRSVLGVVRGLHLRLGRGEGKMVRCSSGRVFDVVVDLRPGSSAYRTFVSFELDGDKQNSIFIPPGCAHGHQTLTTIADTSYRIDRAHDASEDLTIAWNDPELAIPWPLPVTVMSEKDASAPRLAALTTELGRVLATTG
jgi:dTDP-4-dehydrorhamnose 3,5-epimerase